MFPKGLARAFEKFFVSIFRRLIAKEINQIINQISKDSNFTIDQAGDIDDIEIPEERRSLPTIRPSVALLNIGNKIKKVSRKFKRFAESKQLEKLVRKKLVAFDKWSQSRIEMSLKRSVREIKFGISGLKKIGSESITKRVLIGVELQDAGVTAQRLNSLVKRNVNLIKTTGPENFPKIESIVKEGLRKGSSNKMIARELKRQIGKGEKRVKFWARDQSAKAVSQFNKDRQTNAGIPGFIWRHQNDNIVRGNPGGKWPDAENSHWDQEGKFFTWQKGWAAPDGRTLFPGDDFNCRCFPEPAFGPEQAEAA